MHLEAKEENQKYGRGRIFLSRLPKNHIFSQEQPIELMPPGGMNPPVGLFREESAIFTAGILTVLWAALIYFGTVRAVSAEKLVLGISPIVAVPMLSAFGWGAYLLTPGPRALAIDFMVIGAAIAVWTDFRWTYMYNFTTWSTAAATVTALIPDFGIPGEVTSTLLGIVVVAGFFGLFYLVSLGRAMGLGDVFLGISIGAAMGFSGSLTFLVALALVSLVIGVTLLARGRRGEISYGPCIGAGVAVALGFSRPLTHLLGVW